MGVHVSVNVHTPPGRAPVNTWLIRGNLPPLSLYGVSVNVNVKESACVNVNVSAAEEHHLASGDGAIRPLGAHR